MRGWPYFQIGFFVDTSCLIILYEGVINAVDSKILYFFSVKFLIMAFLRVRDFQSFFFVSSNYLPKGFVYMGSFKVLIPKYYIGFL